MMQLCGITYKDLETYKHKHTSEDSWMLFVHTLLCNADTNPEMNILEEV